ncbi:MAG TPA: AAA family ATPase, partial [Acidimicrobiia bacterium]
MYLKSLKLVGFKSFADRARLEFRPGVTVVVGPNGSGKSNLVDALSWVLGTQSTKTLRTGRMEDVIFAGTATRPSLGKAETTLVIDNTERQIDLDLDEVVITRRLYRDGSSDYELNGVGCRLLDIQDLLSDSGVGRHQHVIIGQGEIGRVLNASPEEHRAVIEEAAGILKHRRRKERSERRLERTDEDMLRLNDLLGEIGRQMRPLRRQARAAEQYEGLKNQATALSLYLGGQELTALDRELTIAVSEKSMLTEGLVVDQTQLQHLTERLTELTEQAAAVGAELDRDTTAAALLETTNERLRRVSSVAVERSRAVSGRREAVEERRTDLEGEAVGIVEQLTEIETELREADAVASRAEASFRRLEDEERAIATQNSLSPEGALAAARGELSALESSLGRDLRELEKVTHRGDVLSSQRADESEAIERINDEIREMDASISTHQAAYDSASKDRAARQTTWSAAEDARALARIEVAAADARCEAIRTAVQGRFDSEARRAVESANGVLGSLTGQLDIPDGLEPAVNAALGEWADAVAFDQAKSVQEAVEIVKGAGGGSVSVVSAMSEIGAPAAEVAAALGLDTMIDRLGPAHHRGLATRLLGDVILVEGWGAGWDLVARHPSLRAVTPEGDVISASGIRIADPDGAGWAMLEAAEVTRERAVTELARAESIHTAAKRDFERSRDTERTALETLEQAESVIAGHSEAMKRLQSSLLAIEEEQARIEDRRVALAEAIDAGRAQSVVLDERLRSLEGEEASRLAAWEDMEIRRLGIAADREVARSEWQEAATSLRAVIERKTLLQVRRDQVHDELGRLDLGVVADTDPERLEVVAGFARRAVVILEGRLEQLRLRQGELRAVHHEVRREVEESRTDHERRSQATSDARSRVAE